ncbi:hypothetical protein AgCh_022068 [Apium graveolens]
MNERNLTPSKCKSVVPTLQAGNKNALLRNESKVEVTGIIKNGGGKKAASSGNKRGSPPISPMQISNETALKNTSRWCNLKSWVSVRDLAEARRVARVNKDKSSSSSARGIGGDLVIGRKEGAKKKMIIKENRRTVVGINGVEVENIVNDLRGGLKGEHFVS